jgi:hypothetical protein
MITIHDRLGLMRIGALLLAVVGGGQLVKAQDDDEPEEPVEVRRVVARNDRLFDQLVFGNSNPTIFREQFDSLLTREIVSIDETYGLNEDQKRKLRLAGRGDIKRYFDHLAEKREEFERIKNDNVKVVNFRRQLNGIRLGARMEPFGDGSLFSKTIKTTLSPKQAADYELALRDAKLARHRTAIDLVVDREDRLLKMSVAQRRQFRDALLRETVPALKRSPYDYYVIILQLSRLPEDKVRPIFSDPQWASLRQRFAQVKQLEPMLRESGVLRDQDQDPTAEHGHQH